MRRMMGILGARAQQELGMKWEKVEKTTCGRWPGRARHSHCSQQLADRHHFVFMRPLPPSTNLKATL